VVHYTRRSLTSQPIKIGTLPIFLRVPASFSERGVH